MLEAGGSSHRGLLLSTVNAAALWPFFMFPFLLSEGFFSFSSKLLSPGGPRCLSEAGCFKPQHCSPSASGLSSHNPSISGSAECCWRRAKKKNIEIYSCTLAEAIINGQKLVEGGGECGKNRKSKMLQNAANN